MLRYATVLVETRYKLGIALVDCYFQSEWDEQNGFYGRFM